MNENNKDQHNESIAPPSEFTNYNNEKPQDNAYAQSQGHEVAYYPIDDKPKKKKKRIILKTVLAVVCAFAISIGSVATYIHLDNNGFNFPFSSSHKDKNNNSEDEQKRQTNVSKEFDKNLPTLLQMASKENALTVPQIVKKVTPSVVGISSVIPEGKATGTGIIMTDDGYIVTNAHVVENAASITVVFISEKDTEDAKAKLVGIDSRTDLAVLKVDKKGLTPAEFGMSKDLEVGEVAIAIGNPLGFELSGSVTGGIISALNRELEIDSKKFTLIQTDAAINNGNSGGPLVNCYGQVIGINSIKIQSGVNQVEGIGFAIPIDGAKPIIDELIQHGYVTGRPLLGISGQNITEAQAKFNDIPQGVFVVTVTADTGAGKAGLKPGDIITGINSKNIKTMAELSAELENFKAGDTVTVNYSRDGEDNDVEVTLTENKQ